jgi:hypothetical protein
MGPIFNVTGICIRKETQGGHVITKTEIGMMCSRAKETQRLLATPKLRGKPRVVSPRSYGKNTALGTTYF